MKRKVSVTDLKLGMYVVELDRPWEAAPFEPPFELQGFTVTDRSEIDKLQHLCRYVYIDPDLGVAAKRYLSEAHDLAGLDMVLDKTVDTMPLEDFYPEQVTVEEELDRAQEILRDTQEVYEQVVKDIQAGELADMKSVKKVVGSLVESVIRNPAATAWLVRLKHRDHTTYSHSMSVCVLALTLGRFLGLPKNNLDTLGTATLLQDLGKIKLPTELLSKEQDLTDTEQALIRKHVDLSIVLLKSMEGIEKEVLSVVAAHHERFDGSGYPRKFSRSQISVLAVIAGMADSYEAMISDRPHRKAKTSFQALMQLYEERDRAFPGGLVEQFIQCVGIFPVGSFVRLNTQEVGVVVSRNRVQQLKPRVMILIDAESQNLAQPLTVDLAAQHLLPVQTPRMIAKIVEPRDYDLDPDQFFL